MAKIFRPSNRESSILSKIESSKEFARRKAINNAKEVTESLANAISMKLIERKLIETKSKASLEEQFRYCIDTLSREDEFEIDYKTSPFRKLVPNPNIVSLYLTAFVLETLIDHRDIIDIYGSDEDIYLCIHHQVNAILPR